MSADLHHLSAAYALNALDDIERQQFENHYPTCDICSADVQDFRNVAAAMATSTATTAPSSLKASVMSEITQTRQLAPEVTQTAAPAAAAARSPFSGRVFMAAAAALIVLAGVLAVTLPDSGDLSFNEVAEASDAIVTNLDPLVDGQGGDLQIVWSDEQNGVVVIGSDLADPGVGQAYALWFLLDEGVAPAGLFRPQDGSVSEVLEVDDLDTNGWGISIEPAGGSPQPTTEVLFAGTL